MARRKKNKAAGAPAWMSTFADLSTLLLCFFVLLLSFSEMDIQRYKMVMGSMRDAFGVQREVTAEESPLGTSFVAQKFSPGPPQPTPLAMVRQQVAPQPQQYQEIVREGEPSSADQHQGTDGAPRMPDSVEGDAQVAREAARIRESLSQEVQQGLVEVEAGERVVTIRIREQGSFPSGQAELIRPFVPVIRKIARAVESTPGQVVVAGHTDNVPIRTDRFRSNWELSAARAVTVTHYLLEESEPFDEARITVVGHADTRPLVPNDSWDNRARNRRVEIRIVKGKPVESESSADELSGGRVDER
ncbi:type VI secretion system protein TssL, long form [Alkalilimnicola sp. S0819]|uniref:type VI secretion system protein TssL, long form n=1 Tax=Alkalilimnicola sp. S0819 TaxID=2613922 RepID=UPI001261E699|nr:type VI secretion system protein TssL, long form [Alkalilimnicola sp. S0819]KAB7622628.1 type VI secretion system protein TssL [Alkalilimnicola sp. S0819]MPQ17399.1 type VI secretion system protein TssL [Alkalilimnicola sp. S0819]